VVRKEVVALGTGFSIVTPYTSFVAVDVTPRVAPEVLDEMIPQCGTDEPLRLLLGSLLAAVGLAVWLAARGLR
jgi:hypothetical protein